MQTAVITIRNDLEILDAIVELISIDVVNLL